MPTESATYLEEARNLQRSGRVQEALTAYHRFLGAEQGHADAWSDLGGLLVDLGRPEEAVAACGNALGIDPAHPGAMVNLGCARLAQGSLVEAEGLFRRALAADPHLTDARLDLAECLIQEGSLEDARRNLEKLLRQDPANEGAFNKLHRLLFLQGDLEAMGVEIERRLKVVPDCVQTLVLRSFLNLRLGNMPLGWEQYEVRFRVKDQALFKNEPFQGPLWSGEPFPGKTLLLHWEQGFGDTLMFIRYASKVKALGGRVVVLAQRQLADLVATCPGIDQVVAQGDPVPPYDLQLPLLSLPRVFRTYLASIPAEVPYLDVPVKVPHREQLAQVLAVSEGRVRIGYAWAGHPGYLNDKNRSVPPAALAPLAALPGVAWHSFQMPPVEPRPLPSVPLSSLLTDFSDTAYALSGMDLVVTVDTALAHAAGALGIPTLLMVPFDPDWRWLLGRADSPWYPTLRIYRQASPGDWESVIQAILGDLGTSS